jgi:hypothetical protein
MASLRARWSGLLLALSGVLVAPSAAAQLHWDASAQAGVMKRVLGSRPDGGPDAGFGPVAQLTGHVALFPLVRVGAYFGHDISPMGGDLSARDLTWGGVRAKLMSPWPRGAFRAWLFAGFGLEGVYARSTARPGGLIDGAGGHFFEVPFGLGSSYTFRKPYALCAELGMRAGFAHSGSAYEPPARRTEGLAPGADRFAIGLTVGFMLDL